MRRTVTLALLVGALAATATGIGCGSGQIPEPASPIVSPDSEKAREARAQDEQFDRARKAEEARFRRRVPGLPTEG